MEPLPLPPPPPGRQGQLLDPATGYRRLTPLLRAGQLSMVWRAVFVVGWGGVILGLGAVVKSSRTVGLSTWWLGPDADPNPLFIQALPFAIAFVMIVLGFRNTRQLPYIGILGAIALFAVATGDIGRFNGLAAAQSANGGVGLLVSVASFAGMLRPARTRGGAADAAESEPSAGTASVEVPLDIE